jgi:pyridoxamine 5'-phosphate oxidase
MKEKQAKDAVVNHSGVGLHRDASSPVRWIMPHLNAEALARQIGEWLHEGTVSAHHPAHLLQFASVDHNTGPQLRTVVLRSSEPAAHWVRFHTDIRSPKVEEVRRQPRVALLGYDPNLRLQVRMDAIAAVHHKDSLAKQGWERTPPHSRASYASKRVPGEALKQDVVHHAHAPIHDLEDPAYNNYAVIHCAIEVIDLLELDSDGHRRGTLVRAGGEWCWQPVAP